MEEKCFLTCIGGDREARNAFYENEKKTPDG